MTHSDNERVWLSRVSFGVAAVALSAMVYGGCQQSTSERPSTQAEPASETPAQRGAVQAVEKPKVVPAMGETQPQPAPEVAKSPAPVEPAKDAVEKAPAPPELAGTLTVKRLSVTSEVKDREPVATESLSVGGGILAFVEMANAADVDQTIVVTFEGADQKKVGFVELKVPAKQPRWRTWGQTKNIRSAGEWTAIVSTKDGTELSRTTFAVEPAITPAG